MHKFSKVVVTILLLIIVSFCIQGFDIVNADSGIQYMPPNPDIYGDENPIDGSVHNNDLSSGASDSPSLSSKQLIPEAGDTEKVLVIPIQFQDEHFDSAHTWTYFTNMMNQMKDYYEKNSRYEEDLRGITVECTVAPIVNSSYNMSHYGRDTNTAAGQIDDYYDDIYELAREAVRKLDLSDFDFREYDTDGNGVIDHLFIIHAGDGQENSSNDDTIWSHRWEIDEGENVDGVVANNYVCVPETGTLGVFAHEFGHDLGLPDLYDTDYNTNGITYGVGDWDIMGHGSWNGQPAGSCPSNLSAWSRVFLGWETPQNITSNGTYNFTNTAGVSNIYKFWTNGITSGDEYYLVEYRRQIGYDVALPGEGLLVWHIDKAWIDQKINSNLINAYEDRLGVELEQADGDWDLWYYNNPGDDTDPFSDASGGNPHFTYMPYGLFNISNIDSHFSYVDMLNVDISGSTARADFYITTSYPREQATLIGPADGAKTGLLPTFSWGPVAQAQSFVLQIADDAGFTTNINSITITDENEVLSYSNGVYPYTWSGSPALSYNKTYYWRVVGINDSSTEGNREYSDTRTFTTYSDQCDLTAFSVPGQTGASTINTTNHTVFLTVPYGTAVDDLVATFSVSANATARVGTTTQVSGTTHNNFNNPVTYRVTAENGLTYMDWVVTVTQAAPRIGNSITSFSVEGETGVINSDAHTIAVTVPYGTDVTALIATFILSDGATASIGSIAQESGVTENSFDDTVTYTVTAEDSTTQDWDVTVTVADPRMGKAITDFSVAGEAGIINSADYTVAVTVPYGTDVTALIATFILSDGATASIGSIAQESGVTENDFTNDVTYTVKAEDSTTQDWTVTVTIAPNTETDITAYSMSEQSKAATINATNHTVAITVANGTDVTALVATFTLSDFATAKVSETPQVSGITANDFTNPVTYTVTGEDGTTTQDWVVTVTVASASSGGGGGGVGGGGSTFASASISGKDILISYEADGSTITLNLTKKIMNDLKDMGLLEDGLELDLSNISRAKELLLPSDTGIFDTESLTIIFPALEVELDQDTLTMLKEAADGGDISIMAKVVASSVLTQAQKEQVGENPVYDVTVLAGGNQVSELGGELTVTIPYTLGEGDDPGNIVVWYLKDDGELVQMSCTYDEETESVSFVTDHLSYYAVVYSNEAAWNNPFSDVSDTAWYYDAVAYANQHGLFKGVSANTFDPNGSTTRAMVVTVLWRMAGEPAAGVSSFSDVNDEVWYADAVTWAAENGIVNGVGDGLFKPDANITREQLAVILYNYADFMEYEMSGDLDTNIPSYNDATNISQYAYSSLDWACGSGLIEGAAGKLDPKGQATRAQISAILMRFMENIAE